MELRETGTGTNPAWEDLSSDRQADLARRMAIYAAMVDRMDQQIGRLVDDLKAKDEFKNTVIIFTSDNGACAEWDPRGFDVQSSDQNILHTGEDLEKIGGPETCHSAGSGWANAANTPWRLYKHFNHEGGIALPCIVHWPDGLPADLNGSIHEQPAHIIDFMPTALKLAGLSAEAAGEMAPVGKDLFTQLTGNMPERTLFFEHEGHRAVREGKGKLVALDEENWELYDFTTDRTELNDLADEHPGVVEELAAKWEAWGAENNVTPLPENLKVKYLRAD